ncbi:histidine kinase [Undibacterium sp. 5I1]|uniref:sensor histidine kinase n=1 Tax=unclassified Undibacterium TaxID=2630295 RepID=UPI002AB440C5|nr:MULTISPECIES: histidine kinase [unclassified Undibacterium]MDY7537499.1 histidine kinase [Undibacterium sp. 5I1]MEB0230920.1 histidine kinase [Undibacterium sp. 10I3]MEB0258241.1 histidine kinase [Undibacterium sp. 5I1]
MNPNTLQTSKEFATSFLRWLSKAFDKTAAWVTQLSWWKFFLFAIVTMIAGAILQDNLFSSEESVVVTKKKAAKKASKSKAISDGDTNIEIDGTGIHIRKNKTDGDGKQIEIDENGIRVLNGNSSTPTEPAAPVAPAESAASEASAAAPAAPAAPIISKNGQDDIHIKLPPEVAQEISNDIEDAVADAADEEVKSYQKKSSKWFINFVMLLIFGLLGMKALMGGKVRAEEKAKQANASAERESLLRQVSEAQMQMMQAQVEPHFLFNTLASVEYLIETDPPRAAAMQRSLISYLRAVLPQMRENAATTNLGREADMVRSYLDLLKMRMEERLEVDFIMPEGLRSASFPPMMLQSLVENAIKHGLEVKAEGGTIRFHAEVAHNKLRVSVSDNGLGFGAMPSNGTGLGLQNIRERLKLIYKEKGQMIITPNQPTGVCVTIEIPYELAN